MTGVLTIFVKPSLDLRDSMASAQVVETKVLLWTPVTCIIAFTQSRVTLLSVTPKRVALKCI